MLIAPSIKEHQLDMNQLIHQLGTNQCLIIIYIGYWSLVDSLWWDVESSLELDFEGANIPMGLSSPHFEPIYLVGTSYEG